ncbi:MAG: VWA domain-containing protein [Acidobacteria bacterium]|nr:VWA domain-containing protein [Acidobacteriota bacterium]
MSVPHRLLCWTSALLAAAPLAAQDPDLPGPAIFLDRTEVHVVNVEALVTDAEGRPVSGLTADDFEVLEDGRPVVVTNFYAVGGDATGEALDTLPVEPGVEAPPQPKPPAQSLNLVVFVDDTNLTAGNRGNLFARLRTFLTEQWRRDMRVMVVSNDRELLIEQGFTQSPREVFAALDRLEKRSVDGSQFELERQQLLEEIAEINVEAGSGLFHTKGGTADISQGELAEGIEGDARSILPQIRAYSQQRLQQVLATVDVFEHLVDTLAGVGGRKAVLYASDGLPLRPGEDLFEAWERQVEILSRVAPITSAGMESSRYTAVDAFQHMVADANAASVTFYTLSVPPPASLRGADSRLHNAWMSKVSSLEEASRHDSMELMAEGTGGRTAFSPSVLGATLTGVLDDFDHVYALGYAAELRGDGEPRRITVKLKQPEKGWKLRYRRFFRDKTEDERLSERTLTALVLDASDNPLAIGLDVRETQAREDGTYEVPMLVSIPLGRLVLLPGERFHDGRISLYIAARDEMGRTSRVNKHVCPVRIVNSEILVAMGRNAACGVRMLMRPGKQRVAVTVRDELSLVDSTVALEVEIPSPEPSLAAASGPAEGAL